MANTTNSGQSYEIRNISVGTTDVPIDFNERFINSCMIKCRTSVDIYFRKTFNDSNYLTIPAGSTFTLDCALIDQIQGGRIIGYIRSSSGTVTIEVLGTY